MAITLIDLAAALRIGDGVNAPEEPIAGILNRLMGVSEAFVDLMASTAPEPIRDEATVRMSAYLYDAPTASRGDKYANAWANSGAAGLLSRWTYRRTAQGDDSFAPGSPGGGVNIDGVNELIQEAIATLDVMGQIATALDVLDVPNLITTALDTLNVPDQIATAVSDLDVVGKIGLALDDLNVPGQIETHAEIPAAHHVILTAGGFPSTRTQVFGGTLHETADASAMANEPWLPNQLYEAVVNNASRTLFLTEESGAATYRFGTPFENPEGSYIRTLCSNHVYDRIPELGPIPAIRRRYQL